MPKVHMFSAIIVTALFSSFVVAGLSVARPAHAESQRTMECAPGTTKLIAYNPANVAKVAGEQVTWANQQLAAGRTNFGIVPLPGFQEPSPVAFCAW